MALAGVIAAVALVLPGISISYLLLVMGLYDEIMRAIGDFYLPFLIPFGVGLILGVVLTTRLLERAMNRHPLPTYLIILGFMFGSMVEVFPGIPPWPEVLLVPGHAGGGVCRHSPALPEGGAGRRGRSGRYPKESIRISGK